MLIVRNYQYRLNPSNSQTVKLFTHLTLCRKLYNACLSQRKIAYAQSKSWIGVYNQNNQLPEVKDNIPEYNEVHSQVLQNTVDRCGKSYKNFFDRVKRGEKPGFPRFKSRYHFNSFCYPQTGFKLLNTKKHSYLKLSKIGDVKIIYHRPLPDSANIKTLTIKKDKANNWYAVFSIEVNCETKVINKIKAKNNAVGIDLGIKNMAFMTDGTVIENPHFIGKSEDKKKKLQKGLFRSKKKSMNRNKARIKLARCERKIANQRSNFHHKLSHEIVNKYDLIALEDLNIKNMTRNHKKSKEPKKKTQRRHKNIHDSGWGSLKQKIIYKAEEAGKLVVEVDPRNTSQKCSSCGALVPKGLNERTHECKSCGYTSDRDLNAAHNILNIALGNLGLDEAEVTPMDISTAVGHDNVERHCQAPK